MNSKTLRITRREKRMTNYIPLLILAPMILASALIKQKKLFVKVNLVCVILLVAYYCVMIYFEYQYTVDSLYIHTTEDGDTVVQWMIEVARPKFNNIIYHLTAVTVLLLLNSIIFVKNY